MDIGMEAGAGERSAHPRITPRTSKDARSYLDERNVMARKQGTKVPAATAAAATTGAAGSRAGRVRQQAGHQLRPASSSSGSEEIGDLSHNLRFDLTDSIAYHAIREQFFARLNRFLTGVQVLLGTGAVAALASWVPDAAVWFVCISALAGVMLLIIDPAGAARDHRALRTRLNNIQAGLFEIGETAETLRAGRAQMLRVSADAPPAYRAAQALAYNNAVNALYPEDAARQHRYKVGFWRGLVANWLPMRGHRFSKES